MQEIDKSLIKQARKMSGIQTGKFTRKFNTEGFIVGKPFVCPICKYEGKNGGSAIIYDNISYLEFVCFSCNEKRRSRKKHGDKQITLK